MDNTIEIDLGQAARELGLPLDSVQKTVALLDDGNTVPFITRYRKDQTGALDEEQIRHVQEKVGKLRALAERKQTILKSIQAQGLMTPELAEQIRTANSAKRLEDLYLPYKPKKQTLATIARQRGLEPLAREVLDADPAAADLTARAANYVAPERELHTVDDVLNGVRHIIAEWLSERADVRGKLRKVLQRTAKLVCSRIEASTKREAAADAAAPPAPAVSPAAPHLEDTVPTAEAAPVPEAAPQAATDQEPVAPAGDSPEPDVPAGDSSEQVAPAGDSPEPDVPAGDSSEQVAPAGDSPEPDVPAGDSPEPVAATPAPEPDIGSLPAEPSPAVEPLASQPPSEDVPLPVAEATTEAPVAELRDEGSPADPASGSAPGETAEAAAPPPTAATAPTPVAPPPRPAAAPKPHGGLAKVMAKKRSAQAVAISKKEKKRQRLESAFKDYFSFQESISRIPPHRILAINRGERARILRVKMEADVEAMMAEADAFIIRPDHPHAEFLRSCVRDALNRLLIPSLERELRREMAEIAEVHAVEVFARNLRKLLLQPPVHQHRVLAIDPGFRSGCKLIALDEFGNVLGHDIIHVIGKEEWIRASRAKVVDLIRRHRLTAIAIGNGAGCRETEQLVVNILANELQDEDVSFVIVNEAGASVYSTSPVGREELPQYDAVLRSAISIGRRLLDPLSELVKINPANIGVGMYQHDVKAKHLRNSLDAVVESCVNYVGVDVNTASPALLRYVSGMNQLTARRLCEYRAKNGPFRSREQLKQVSGLGDATFVQAAGFLKVTHGDNPLDATWIHPESYELASRVLEKAGCNVGDLAATVTASPVPAAPAPFSLPPASAPERTTEPPGEPAMAAVTDLPASDLPDVASVTAEPEVPTESPALPAEEAGDASASHLNVVEAEPAPATSPAAAPMDEPSDAVAALPAAAEPAAPESSAEPTAEPQPAEPAAAAAPQATVEARPTQSASEPVRLVQERVRRLDPHVLAGELGVSDLLLRDILSSLARPGRDPREDLPAPVFRRGIVKLEDLEPGMKLAGTVLNVVDFGAFVDIGLPDSGLVHISRLADRFVRDPHEVVGVGDVLTVWVVEIDKQRRRVSLTAIEPGTERPAEARREPARPQSRRPSPKRSSSQSTGAPASRPRSGAGGQRPKPQQRPRPAPKPKFVKPITKEMEEGKEPLRSFSDLMQFYQKKQSDGK